MTFNPLVVESRSATASSARSRHTCPSLSILSSSSQGVQPRLAVGTAPQVHDFQSSRRRVKECNGGDGGPCSVCTSSFNPLVVESRSATPDDPWRDLLHQGFQSSRRRVKECNLVDSIHLADPLPDFQSSRRRVKECNPSHAALNVACEELSILSSSSQGVQLRQLCSRSIFPRLPFNPLVVESSGATRFTSYHLRGLVEDFQSSRRRVKRCNRAARISRKQRRTAFQSSRRRGKRCNTIVPTTWVWNPVTFNPLVVESSGATAAGAVLQCRRRGFQSSRRRVKRCNRGIGYSSRPQACGFQSSRRRVKRCNAALAMRLIASSLAFNPLVVESSGATQDGPLEVPCLRQLSILSSSSQAVQPPGR